MNNKQAREHNSPTIQKMMDETTPEELEQVNAQMEGETAEIVKDLGYWKANAEDNYMTTPISVLKYITELEKAIVMHGLSKKLGLSNN